MTNEDKYLEIIKQADPDLYMIKIALTETKVNPLIIPRIIRSLSNLNVGTGYGEVTILMTGRTITQIKGSESDILNMSVDKEP